MSDKAKIRRRLRCPHLPSTRPPTILAFFVGGWRRNSFPHTSGAVPVGGDDKLLVSPMFQAVFVGGKDEWRQSSGRISLVPSSDDKLVVFPDSPFAVYKTTNALEAFFGQEKKVTLPPTKNVRVTNRKCQLYPKGPSPYREGKHKQGKNGIHKNRVYV